MTTNATPDSTTTQPFPADVRYAALAYLKRAFDGDTTVSPAVCYAAVALVELERLMDMLR